MRQSFPSFLLAYFLPGFPYFAVFGPLLVNFPATMLHSFHHAFQHASVCGTLQGTWAAIRVATGSPGKRIRKPAGHILALPSGTDHGSILGAPNLVGMGAGQPSSCLDCPAQAQRSVI
jgi:uncharacterized protein YjlB